MSVTTRPTFQDLFKPHVDEYAKALAGKIIACAEPNPECPRLIHIDTDEWVLLRDAYADADAFVLHPAHRACAEIAWGKAHILPRPPDPKAPADLPDLELQSIVEGIQQAMYYDFDEKVWDRDRPVNGGDLVEAVGQLLEQYDLAPPR